jgi:hypothetical protein
MNLSFSKLDNLSINIQSTKSGLGSIDFGNIQITNMGPHYFPLGDLSRFGIYHLSEESESFHFSENSISLLSKLIACDQNYGSGATWMQFKAEKRGEEFIINAKFENFKGEDPFAFVFFVKSEEVRHLDKKYKKGALQKFSGPSSFVDLISAKKKVSITSETKLNLEIIPLGGDEAFYKSDFLIAFHIQQPENGVTFVIKNVG